MELTPAQRDALLDLARRTIRGEVCGPRHAVPFKSADPALLKPAGCFVSLHERDSHRLRGCIGSIAARDSLWQAVSESALNVLGDPRFTQNRVTCEELSELEIEITVLSSLEPASDPLDFDPQRHGIYLKVNDRVGCFLPQVARDTGWPRETLLERLCTEKLELPGTAWQSPNATLETFTATIIGPEPFARDENA